MFVKILFGQQESFILNPSSSYRAFVHALQKNAKIDMTKFHKDGMQLDLIDENGAMIHLYDVNEDTLNIKDTFVKRMTYLPVMVQLNKRQTAIIEASPLLDDWEKLYPIMKKKILLQIVDKKKIVTPAETSKEHRGKGKRAMKEKVESSRRSSLLGVPSSPSKNFQGNQLASNKSSNSFRKAR